MRSSILHVKNLAVSFSINGQKLHAVRGIDFDLKTGETIGIVGESGSGKSVAIQSLTHLIPSPPCIIESGEVILDGLDLLKLSPKELRKIRSFEIGMIFQDPMTSLNPTMKIGAQIIEGLLYHRLFSLKEAKNRGLELLHLVGIPDPELRFSQFPHELSGGMRQRVLIAIALSTKPRILIADEPTTALDPTIQIQILSLLKDLQKRLQMSMIFISHDIGIVTQMCDHVYVMLAGKIIEEGSAEDVFYHPKHPYTQKLLLSLPKLNAEPLKKLSTIEGPPPNPFDPAPGCSFASRCKKALDICYRSTPPSFSGTCCWLKK